MENSFSAGCVQRRFRRLSAERYPRLATMSRDEMYDGGKMMAPGGMLLASMMAEHLMVQDGSRILDVGCGRGQTSIMLASRFACDVVSLDLWISAAERQQLASDAGIARHVHCLQGDITRGLPESVEPFDAIFVMQAFHSFGTRPGILRYLRSLLKPGGRMVIGQTCFRSEPETLSDLLHQDDGWNTEYRNYHSPDWWSELFRRDRLFDIELCKEIKDGDIFWEDHVLYCGDREGWPPSFVARHGWLIRHIIQGRVQPPHLTHFLMTAKKPNPLPR